MKEVISKARKGALRDLGIDKPYFRSLDFGEYFGFCWVFSPGLRFYKLLQGFALKVTLEAGSRSAS
jgi:hypothetical protein